MLKILIVDGNSQETIERGKSLGFEPASKHYQNALSIHEPNAHYDVAVPYAPVLGTKDIDPSSYDGIALTGSGVSWCASDSEAKPYMTYLEKLLDTGKPMIGCCWGMQSVAVALGGECAHNPQGTETGIAKDVELTQDGISHPIYAGISKVFSSPCIHRDHVTRLPQSAKHLAKNAVSENQSMSYNLNGIDFFGVQFHPELEISHIKRVLKKRGNIPNTQKIILNFPEENDPLITDEKYRTALLANWLKHVDQIKIAT